MDDHFNSIFMYKTHSTKTLCGQSTQLQEKDQPAQLAVFWCVFSLVVHKVRVTAVGQLNQGRNRNGEGGGDKAHCLLPSPSPPSFSFLGSAFTCLKLLLYQPQKKKNTPKKKNVSCTGYKNNFHVVNDMPQIHYLVNDPHHR